MIINKKHIYHLRCDMELVVNLHLHLYFHSIWNSWSLIIKMASQWACQLSKLNCTKSFFLSQFPKKWWAQRGKRFWNSRGYEGWQREESRKWLWIMLGVFPIHWRELRTLEKLSANTKRFWGNEKICFQRKNYFLRKI